ncbi:MAG: rod shape-determining protein MreC [SAR324 cluster bacterium]|uniref:Cell shape-determining protein MreC n=1 Tax=SAR324 cluster bacterium TaxID=2024889 RepID=A0A7X9FS28_9DELT|nr:rod shape-determining protein MreC [SAR324 cluster bacterium]
MASATSSKTKVILTAFGLFICSLFLTAYSAQNPEIARIGYYVVGEISRPIQVSIQNIFEMIDYAWNDYLYLINVRQENEELRVQLKKLESEVVGLSNVEAENKRLSSLLGFVNEANLGGVVARVIGYSPSNWQQTATLNRGYLDGIDIDMAVVDGRGIVGQVIEVSPRTTKVLLATDPTSGVDALLQENRARGIISGTGRGRYTLQFLSREQQVRIGDRVVTSGVGGIFAHGLLIGTVADIKQNSTGMFQEVEVSPSVDFSRLEEVLVLTYERSSKVK